MVHASVSVHHSEVTSTVTAVRQHINDIGNLSDKHRDSIAVLVMEKCNNKLYVGGNGVHF